MLVVNEPVKKVARARFVWRVVVVVWTEPVVAVLVVG
jgi:hypothetical protein